MPIVLRLPRFLVAMSLVAVGLALSITGEWVLVAAAWCEDVDISSAID